MDKPEVFKNILKWPVLISHLPVFRIHLDGSGYSYEEVNNDLPDLFQTDVIILIIKYENIRKLSLLLLAATIEVLS